MQHSRPHGFTLIEILVVLVIIGVIVSATTVAIGVLGRDSEIEDQVRRLAAVMTQAHEEAQLQGREIGVYVDRTGYEFLFFDARKQIWQPPSDDDLFAAKQLAEGLGIRLWMEGREVVLKSHDERAGIESEPDAEETSSEQNTSAVKNSGPTPQVMLLSSGDVNAFELRVEREATDHVWRIASQLDNTLLTEEIRELE